ncbi:sugar ABC transporter ATP-binding protein [Mesorhizobium sp. IMUNJ 23232]|uniref:sugar ABC transporter ATP-binding protein n=1 Tax=Mesorhizobium sp. IMUNJ 23232 TaxID=3376064 RepID=UPI00379945F2
MNAASGISLHGVSKHYGNTVALNGVDLDIRPGEILGIAGPNGAGKSTLVRIVGGEERPSSGTLTFDGKPWSPTDDWHAVAVVHQEPQLFPNLTVAQNVMAGREGTSRTWPKLGAADAAVMDALGLTPWRDTALADCSLATQQRTEIARAVARDARVFLFDEPNSALTAEESDELFREMDKLAASGRMVVLITHRLNDLVSHCARVAVVRDGRVRTILSGDALTEDGLARQLVTESAQITSNGNRASGNRAGKALFSVREWSHATAFKNISFDAHAGEIVALMGVEGSGARELLRSFAGLERTTGAVRLGETGDIGLRRLRSYVPATRALSLYSNFSVGDNLLVRLGIPEIAWPSLALKRARMKTLAQAAVKRFLVKTGSIGQPIRSLSGGNQQKVAIAQALNCSPELLVLEEPTRGVDIHSKAEIYRLLRDYAASGKAVVIFCTEVLEIFEVADTAYVVSDGRLSPPLSLASYDHVEQLATDITRLEAHGRTAKAA